MSSQKRLTKSFKIGPTTDFSLFDNNLNVDFLTIQEESPCLSANSMETSSDSVFMYDIQDNNSKKFTETTIIGEKAPTLEDLDPTFELAVDLQDLIQETNQSDLFSTQLAEVFNQLQGNANISTGFVNNLFKQPAPEIVQPAVLTPVVEENRQMPHLNWMPPTDNQFVVIKTENAEPNNLDLAALLSDTSTPENYFQFNASSPEGTGEYLGVMFCKINVK